MLPLFTSSFVLKNRRMRYENDGTHEPGDINPRMYFATAVSQHLAGQNAPSQTRKGRNNEI